MVVFLSLICGYRSALAEKDVTINSLGANGADGFRANGAVYAFGFARRQFACASAA
jgi:hypothetical protein